MAASLGMPYVFALFLNNNDRVMDESVATYRQQFNSTKGIAPQVLLALPVIVADTDAEAQHYASEIKMVRIRLQSGRTFTVGTLEAAEEFAKQSQEAYTIEVQEGKTIHGSRDTVQKTLHDIQSRYAVDELMIVTAMRNFQKRLHSYELLKDVFQHDAKVA
jgi:alkanesulfonate monooxygenase SsuD/methylene tetrahydromethanopterin reductase-like flavin-dependent oxidoreductase (luciferase family)